MVSFSLGGTAEGGWRWGRSEVADALSLLVLDEDGHDVLGHLGADERHGVLRRRAGGVGVLVPQLHLPVDEVVVGVGPVVGAGGDLLVGVGLPLGVHDLGLGGHRLLGALGAVELDDEVAGGTSFGVPGGLR